jgi:hypothetical protein
MFNHTALNPSFFTQQQAKIIIAWAWYTSYCTPELASVLTITYCGSIYNVPSLNFTHSRAILIDDNPARVADVSQEDRQEGHTRRKEDGEISRVKEHHLTCPTLVAMLRE